MPTLMYMSWQTMYGFRGIPVMCNMFEETYTCNDPSIAVMRSYGYMTHGCVRWIVILLGRGWAVWRLGGWPS